MDIYKILWIILIFLVLFLIFYIMFAINYNKKKYIERKNRIEIDERYSKVLAEERRKSKKRFSNK